MRPGAGFNATAAAAVATPIVGQSHSAWHSPVPYLFGGLAAMFGLITLALLLLACSYWKLSGYLDGSWNGNDDGESGGDGKPSDEPVKVPTYLCEGIVVIMAGDDKPTFLAIPIASRASSLVELTTCSSRDNKSNEIDYLDVEK